MSRIWSFLRVPVWTLVPIFTPAVLTVAVAMLMVWSQTVGDQRPDTIDPGRAFLITYGLMPATYFVSLFVLTDQATRRLPRAPALSLSLEIATFDVILFHYIIATYFDGLAFAEVIAYTLLAWTTGIVVGLEARRRRMTLFTMHNMVSGVSKTSATGGDAQELVSSIATHMEHPDFRGALLWRVSSVDQNDVAEMTYWAGVLPDSARTSKTDRKQLSQRPDAVSRGQQLLPPSVDFDTPVSVVLAKDCPDEIRRLYEANRFAGVVMLPLKVYGMHPMGALVLGFRSRVLLRRWQLASAPDHFVQLADTVALALQLRNMTQELLIAREKQARIEAEQQTSMKVRADIRRDLHHASSDTYQRVINRVDRAIECLDNGSGQLLIPGLTEQTLAYLREAKNVYRHGQGEIKDLVADLNRPADTFNDLQTEICSEVDKLKADTGADIDSYLPERQQYLSRITKKIIITAIKEAFTNVRKHASPKIVAVSFSYFDNEVVLHIYNDGVIDSQDLDAFRGADSSGIGLGTLDEEVRAIGGTFSCGTEFG